MGLLYSLVMSIPAGLGVNIMSKKGIPSGLVSSAVNLVCGIYVLHKYVYVLRVIDDKML